MLGFTDGPSTSPRDAAIRREGGHVPRLGERMRLLFALRSFQGADLEAAAERRSGGVGGEMEEKCQSGRAWSIHLVSWAEQSGAEQSRVAEYCGCDCDCDCDWVWMG